MLIRFGEMQLLFALLGNRDAGRGHVRFSVEQGRNHIGKLFYRDHAQIDVKKLGECPGHIVFQPLETAGAFIISGRTVDGDDDQLAGIAHTVQLVFRLSARCQQYCCKQADQH